MSAIRKNSAKFKAQIALEAYKSYKTVSIRRQCKLLGLNRSTLYYQAEPVSEGDIQLMRLIDEIYTRRLFYDSRRITAQLNRGQATAFNRKRIQRLMRHFWRK